MDRFANLALEQWSEARPKLVQQLRAQGTLKLYLQRASDRTSEVLGDLVDGGASWDQAWEKASREELFLPAEEDVPDLTLPPE